MEVSHTQLAEVTGMVLVHVDSVVVHATGITTTTRMLAVLSCEIDRKFKVKLSPNLNLLQQKTTQILNG